MNPLPLLLAVFLVYVVWRTVSHFRGGRIHFGIATTFIACIVLFEMVRGLMM